MLKRLIILAVTLFLLVGAGLVAGAAQAAPIAQNAQNAQNAQILA